MPAGDFRLVTHQRTVERLTEVLSIRPLERSFGASIMPNRTKIRYPNRGSIVSSRHSRCYTSCPQRNPRAEHGALVALAQIWSSTTLIVERYSFDHLSISQVSFTLFH